VCCHGRNLGFGCSYYSKINKIQRNLSTFLPHVKQEKINTIQRPVLQENPSFRSFCKLGGCLRCRSPTQRFLRGSHQSQYTSWPCMHKTLRRSDRLEDGSFHQTWQVALTNKETAINRRGYRLKNGDFVKQNTTFPIGKRLGWSAMAKSTLIYACLSLPQLIMRDTGCLATISLCQPTRVSSVVSGTWRAPDKAEVSSQRSHSIRC